MLPLHRQVELVVEDRQSRQASAVRTGAVISLFQCNEVLLAAFTTGVEIVAHHADHGVHRIRAAQGEEHVVEIARRQLGELGRQFNCRLAAKVKIPGCIGQPLHLFGGRGNHIFVAVSRVHAPQAGKSVEQFIAFRVCQEHPFSGLHDSDATLLMGADRHDRMEVVGAVFFDKRIGEHRFLSRISFPFRVRETSGRKVRFAVGSGIFSRDFRFRSILCCGYSTVFAGIKVDRALRSQFCSIFWK